MNSPAAPPIHSFLAQQVRDGASAGQVAALVGSTWEHIQTALAPVIGQRGVAALYKRSLHLAAKAHPWLAAAQGSSPGEDFALLRAESAKRSSAEAATAGAALLLSFHELVGSLIGPSLSGQLLGEVWIKFFSGSSAQDPSP